MNKKATAQQIIDNITARLALLHEQGFNKHHVASNQLQELLDDICRHNSLNISIDTESTLKMCDMVQSYQTDRKRKGAALREEGGV